MGLPLIPNSWRAFHFFTTRSMSGESSSEPLSLPSFRFKSLSCVDNGNGDVQTYPAHISHVWDMAHMPYGEASLTMEDQAEANLIGEDIATVGTDWQSGADLAQAWNDVMQ
jgi:hypothetical protein